MAMRGAWVSIGLWFALAACPAPSSEVCGDGVCPSNLRCVQDPARDAASCAAVQGLGMGSGCALCVLPTCGNGHLDPGEACDDGNHTSGDGCPADCSAPCGDALIDPGEACDPPMAGACSSDCASNLTCGNSKLDPGEACDDGNHRDHDGCSATCAAEQPAWRSLNDTPPPATSHAIAYDAWRGQAVLFGGCPGTDPMSNCTAPPTSDTWLWDGVAWTHAQPPGLVPPARHGQAMAFDARRGVVVMFSGCPDMMCAEPRTDTWEWDGATWTQRMPATVPPGRAAAAMTYDSARGVVVLFGGCGQSPMCDITDGDTWEWDGTDWVQRQVAGPPPRAHAAMVYDPVRDTTVLFGGQPSGPGGAFADTWEWNGTSWRQLASLPPGGPPGRIDAAMAFDPALGRIVMSGGCSNDTIMPCAPLGDLWTWDGTSWTAGANPVGPTARAAPGVFDSARSRLVVFGGRHGAGTALADTWEWDGATWLERGHLDVPVTRVAATLADTGTNAILFGGYDNLSGYLGDTWQWDGSHWQKMAPATAPTPRLGAASAYDSARQRLVVFGGSGPSAETWEFDGTTWQLKTPAVSPPARDFAAMTYDEARGKVVLFGGRCYACSVGVFADTWEYDGTTWTPITTPTSPPGRWGHALAYEPLTPLSGKIVLYGGNSYFQQPCSCSGGNTNDTWEYDGATWTQRTSPTSPPARALHGLAYDRSRSELVLFGGCDEPWPSPAVVACAGNALADTWIWDGTAWSQRTPASSPPAMYGHAMTAGGAVLVVGNGETWQWDGTTWTERSAPASPHSVQAIAYDVARGASVVFGDAGANQPGETWEWTGDRWLARTPATAPPSRQQPSLAYDAARGVTVLFGGLADAGFMGLFLADTWLWDGTSWQLATSPMAPMAREGAAMVYDVAHQEVLLFGGYTGGTSFMGALGDTWAWDGTTWRPRSPSTSPPAQANASIVYDAARATVVLVDQGTWEWDGADWHQVAAQTATPGGQLAYDSDRRTVLAYDGTNTWEWGGTAWTELAATAPPVSGSGGPGRMVFEDARHAALLVSGSGAWTFAYDSAHPTDVCATGFDATGGDAVVCANPDCGGACDPLCDALGDCDPGRARCGDGTCGPLEDCRVCPGDCGVCDACGDLHCDAGETCTSCPGDCGVCP